MWQKSRKAENVRDNMMIVENMSKEDITSKPTVSN